MRILAVEATKAVSDPDLPVVIQGELIRHWVKPPIEKLPKVVHAHLPGDIDPNRLPRHDPRNCASPRPVFEKKRVPPQQRGYNGLEKETPAGLH